MGRKVRLGIIGTGARGFSMMRDVFTQHEDVEIAAVYDPFVDRMEKAADYLVEQGRPRPVLAESFEQLITMEDVEAVYIASSWDTHIPYSIAAMEAGKIVGCEVAGAYSVRDCWRLVETYEKTGTPIMLFENCCYGRKEMMVKNMVKQGVFGRIVHCEGGYCHDLRQELAESRPRAHYRLDEYLKRNGENYPTHELGPIAQVLGINRGNRMLTLCSVSSCAHGLHEYIQEHIDDEELKNAQVNQGDVVNTIIKCANGETILMTLDTTLPRYYCRNFTVQGTKGMYREDNNSIFFDIPEHLEKHVQWHENWDNALKYREQYDDPVWAQYEKDGIKRGHGGMDWLEVVDFIDCIQNAKPMPIDVYDMASWMCITSLSEESIAQGGHPVAIPDFTGGKWVTRK